jgi:hypothetical protein
VQSKKQRHTACLLLVSNANLIERLPALGMGHEALQLLVSLKVISQIQEISEFTGG